MTTIIEIPVLFHSQGVPLAGRFLRADTSLTERQPVVIVSGSWLTVKEQMASVYARKLAERGYTAFIFDFTGFGESGGSPRQTEMPANKIADIKAASAFVSTFSFVEPGRVGYLAICASAQYALAALATGAPIASFASVAGWYHDSASISPFYGGEEGISSRLRRATEAVEAFLVDERQDFVPAYEDGNERAGMFFPLPYYGQADRGAVPQWANQMSEMSWLYWLTYDGLRAAEEVSTPALFVHGDGCVLPDNVKHIHARLNGRKELVWLEGGQIDFYDQPEQVERAVTSVATWFDETLKNSN